LRDERLYIVQMLERAERIFEYTEGGHDEFLTDPKTQDAVLRSFEVMGEAAKRVPQSIRDQAPEVPWKRLAGFRDVLIHQYEGVDLEEVWKRKTSLPCFFPSRACCTIWRKPIDGRAHRPRAFAMRAD
jgi:uncharacterized protein with HEPN domain